MQQPAHKSLLSFLVGDYQQDLPLHHQQQARLINVVLLIFTPLVPFITLIQSLIVHGSLEDYFQRPTFQIAIFGTLGLGVCYVLNRLGQFALVRWLIVLAAASVIIVHAEISDAPHLEILYLLALPVFGLAVFTRLEMIIVSTIITGFLAWFMMRHPAFAADSRNDVVSLVIILSVLLIIISYHRDKLEQRRSRALREKELQLRLLLAQIPARIWALDTLLARIPAIGRAEDGALVRALCADETLQSHLMSAVNGQRQVFEHTWQSIPYRTYVEPLRDSHNAITGCIGMSLDISMEKREAAQELALVGERERVRVLAEFLESASHDIRTPLSIMNMSLTLLERAPEEEKRRHHRQILYQTLKRLEKILESMFAMTRLDTLPQYVTQPTDIKELLKHVVESQMGLAQRQKIQLVSQVDANLPRVCVHGQELRMALGHIVRNGLQNTLAEGCVTVAGRVDDIALTITVTDTGSGIPLDEVQRVFDRFYRLEKHRPLDDTRIGMGLSLAKRVVEKHGGEIDLTSEVGRGTTVTIRLPSNASCA